MKIKTLPLLSLLALSVSAMAADSAHRLAFSKAENLEVFVDHAAGQPWCGPALKLRFAFGGAPNQDAVERLMPRLGGLLGKECPDASTATWHSTDASGAQLASGTSAKSNGWVVVAQAAPAAPAAVAAAPVPVAAPAPSASAAATSAHAPTANAPATPSTPAPTPVATAPVPAVATLAVAAAPAPTPVAEPAEPAPPAAAPPAAAPRPDFTVAGWKPPREDDALAAASFLTILQDQTGCRYRLAYKPDVAPEFLRVEAQGPTCGRDGFATGMGSLSIMRSDGVQLKRIKANFHRGLPIVDGNSAWPVVGFNDERNMLVSLGSDAAQGVHYLAQLPLVSHDGAWHASSLFAVAVTEKIDLFRDIDSIRAVLMAPVAAIEQQGIRTHSLRVHAMRNFEQGLLKAQRNDWLYEVVMQRDWRSKEMGFDPNHATNHLFNFERRQAEIAQREAAERERAEMRQRQQIAMQAENELQLYRSLEEQVRNPQQLMASLVHDINPDSDYSALMSGRQKEVRLIVRVSSTNDEGGRLDYPYDAQMSALNGEKLSKGWYLMSGTARLDPQTLDEQKLPLTRFSPQSLVACEKDGCADLRDPVKLTRHRLGRQDWTPEDAMEKVRSVWPERYAQAGKQE